MSNPSWFNEAYFLNSKLAQLQATGQTQYTNVAQVYSAIVAAGQTPLENFLQFSLVEGTDPDEYFDTVEYLESKALEMGLPQTDYPYVSVLLQEAGFTSAYAHYQAFGWKEGVNPNNDFDNDAYIQDLADLNGISYDAAVAALQAANLNPVSHYYYFGQNEGLVPTPVADPVDPPVGETYTLTTAIDVINGTNGNDTIIGQFTAAGTAGNTLNAGDQINGGGGTNTMKFYDAFNANQVPVTISNVQVLDFVNPGANDINATQIASGVQLLQIGRADAVVGAGRTFTTGAGTDLQLSTLNGATAGAAAGALINWVSSATDTTANLILSGFQGASAAADVADITITGARTTTLNIAANGAVQTGATLANQVGTLTAAATTETVNVVATSATDLGALTGANIATVNAAESTAGVTVNVDATDAALSFTGGAGNDTVLFGTTNTFTVADQVDGGAGVNTLGMSSAQARNVANPFTNIANMQTLRVTDAAAGGAAGDVYNLARFGVQNIRFDADLGNTATVSNVASGATLTTVAQTGVITATITGNTASDSLTIAGRGGAGTIGVAAAQFENVTVNAGAMTGDLVLALTDAQLQTLTLVNPTAAGGNSDVAVDLGTLGTVVSLVDATAFQAADVTNGVTVTLSGTAVNGATVNGSANNDTLNGSNLADTIYGNNGVDTIVGNAGNDTIFGGAGNDIITGSAGKDVIDGGSGIDNFIITAFADSIATGVAGTNALTATYIAANATAFDTYTVNVGDTITFGGGTFGGALTSAGTTVQNVGNALAAGNGVYWNDGTNTYVVVGAAAETTISAASALLVINGVHTLADAGGVLTVMS